MDSIGTSFEVHTFGTKKEVNESRSLSIRNCQRKSILNNIETVHMNTLKPVLLLAY